MDMKQKEFWFVVGSQFLYGPEVLETVAARGADGPENDRWRHFALQAGV